MLSATSGMVPLATIWALSNAVYVFADSIFRLRDNNTRVKSVCQYYPGKKINLGEQGLEP
jgi:hypothetical protein